MKDVLFDEFQDSVGKSLIRHKSILDVMTKYQESAARINRAIAKATTSCGCVSVDAHKQRVPPDISLEEVANYMESHVHGHLCENCQDIVESEIGNSLFYLAALCELLDLNLYDIMLKELKKLRTLGIYNIS